MDEAGHKAAQDWRGVVNAASSQTNVVWLSFLGFCAFLGTAIASATSRQFAAGTPITLPFLSSTPLPLSAFFVVAPATLLLAHLYLLFQLRLLSRRILAFEEAAAKLDERTRRDEYEKLDGFVFTRFFANAPLDRLTRAMVAVGAVATIVVAPILVLMLAEAQFLKDHSPSVTWWHRIIIAADLALLWVGWPWRPRPETQVTAEVKLFGRRFAVPRWLAGGAQELRRTTIRYPTSVLATVFVIFFVTFVATVSGEATDIRVRASDSTQPVPWLPTRLLFAGDVDPMTLRPSSLFSRRVILTRTDLSMLKDGSGAITRLRPQVLREAVLIGATVRGVDLSDSDLTDADLTDAQFTDVILDRANMAGANLSGAVFNNVSFRETSFDGSNLTRAQFTNGSVLSGADIGHVSFVGAYFSDADLTNARIFASDFSLARIENSDLSGAWFAAIENAQSMQIWGSRLYEARFEGFRSDAVSFWGNSFERATFSESAISGDLVGNSFDEAEFIRSTITLSSLIFSSFRDTRMARSRFESVRWHGVILSGSTVMGTIIDDPEAAAGQPCPASYGCPFHMLDARNVRVLPDSAEGLRAFVDSAGPDRTNPGMDGCCAPDGWDRPWLKLRELNSGAALRQGEGRLIAGLPAQDYYAELARAIADQACQNGPLAARRRIARDALLGNGAAYGVPIYSGENARSAFLLAIAEAVMNNRDCNVAELLGDTPEEQQANRGIVERNIQRWRSGR